MNRMPNQPINTGVASTTDLLSDPSDIAREKVTKSLRRVYDDVHPSSLGSFMSSWNGKTILAKDVDDNTEITVSESEYSEFGSPKHSPVRIRRQAGLETLTVAAPAVHETHEDIAIPDLKRHRLLGEGFFGQVWLVESDDHQPYALKQLSKFDLLCEDQVEAVIREKQIMLQLHHPGIVKLLASHQDDTSLYLLQDFYQGGELFSLLHRSKNSMLPESSCQFYISCLTDALWYMHSHSIIYRDCKPENIMIDGQGYPVLIDLGYAKTIPSKGEKTYTLCGTPKYLPPEMIEGAGHTFTADYWSLGVVLYEMLSGEHPFVFWEGVDEMSLYGSISEADYLELPEQLVSKECEDIVDKLLIKKPESRLGAIESNSKNEILEHAWLRPSLNLTAQRRKTIQAPWIPAADNPLDDRHFDPIDEDGDSLSGDNPPLTGAEQERFADFDT